MLDFLYMGDNETSVWLALLLFFTVIIIYFLLCWIVSYAIITQTFWPYDNQLPSCFLTFWLLVLVNISWSVLIKNNLINLMVKKCYWIHLKCLEEYASDSMFTADICQCQASNTSAWPGPNRTLPILSIWAFFLNGVFPHSALNLLGLGLCNTLSP